MAGWLNRWLLMWVIPLCHPMEIGSAAGRCLSAPTHPFHVSVVEVNHNAAAKTLEISCKLFTDDFERVLARNYKMNVDLTNPPVKRAMDTLVKSYVNLHLAIYADGKRVSGNYLGYEQDKEAVFSYFEVPDIPAVKKIAINNKLMYDLFTDEVNIMHVIVNGNRQSMQLQYPETEATLSF